MFDKCTVYTIYNRDDFRRLPIPRNELNGKSDINCFEHLSSSLNDHNTNSRKKLSSTVKNLSSQYRIMIDIEWNNKQHDDISLLQ